MLIASEWLGKFIWQGTGIRHLYLLVIPILFAKRKITLVKVNKVSWLYFLAVLLILLTQSFHSKELNIGTFLGWVFTYYFFFIFILTSSGSRFSFDYKYLIKRIVELLFILSIHPMFLSLINFPSFREFYGVFRDQSAYSSMLCIGAFLSFYMWNITQKEKWKRLLIYFIILVFLGLMKKSILIILLWSALILYPKLKTLERFQILLIGGIVSVIIGPFILNNIFDVLTYEQNSSIEDHVRWGMYFGGAILAINNFPLGSGYGTFGSLFSIYNFRTGTYEMHETYYKLGLNNLADNETKLLTGNTTFLDTYYPHIIAEAGVLQLLLVLGLFVHIYKRLYRTCIAINDMNLFYCCLSIGLMIFIDGITINSPEMPVFIFFYSIMPALIIRAHAKQMIFT